MNLSDLIENVRLELDDTVEPFLWSDAELEEFANDAESEACRRARLIVDSTSAVTTVTLTANDPMVPVDDRIIFVRRLRLVGRSPLARKTVSDMDKCYPSWEDSGPGTPTQFITDYETGSLRLWPTPREAVTVKMTVVRTPLLEMNDRLDVPEIAPRYHRALQHWMRYRAYLKKDGETVDPKAAADALALFEAEFGQKLAAIDEQWIAREQMTDDDGSF